MDQQEWNKIDKIVDTALDLEKQEQATYIQEQCGDDPDLAYQVTKLLKAIDESDTGDFLGGSEEFLGHLADDITEKGEKSYASSLIGETIGNYKITELIGHGGMGSVFLAERADEAYNQQVALKILRRGMETPSNVARFRRERNILARLDHPNIARLLDGGVTADGLPYLIMEYVNGIPLPEYCNTHQLSIEERLALFKSVCTAVQSAHRNATIHRDLKPSNIYVTNEGSVKVLDFGIAKLLEPANPEETLFQTQTGTRMLTLGYAAPEQVENKPITTATDSYTLGLLLYELLAGCHPFDLENNDLLKIENQIRNKTQAKPSVKFAQLPETEKIKIASQRNTTPSAVVQELRGDLDAITMKALRKEPGSRYPSVEQMLEDLNRYDQSLPLIAQSDTLRYRVGKFIRRHRNTVAGILFLLITITGLGSYHFNRVTEERNIAETEAQKAETVKDFLIDIFGSSNPQLASFEGKDISAQQLLINGQNRIDRELQDQPDVYVEILAAIGNALSNIDAFEEAEKSYEQALGKTSETSAPLEEKIKIYTQLGNLYITWVKHEQAYHTALEAQSLLQKSDNPSPALEASVFGLLGRIISVRDNYEQGNSYFKKADSLYKRAGIQNSNDYIQMLTEYGRSLLYVFNFEKAEDILLKSNEIHRQKYDKPTLTVAENYKYIAWTNREMSNFERSNNYFLKSIDLKSNLIGPESVRTAISMYHLARNYTLSGDFERSEKLAQKVLNIYQENLEPSNQYIHQAKNYLAIAKHNQNKLSEAEKLLRDVVERRREIDTDNQMFLAGVLSNLAVVYQKTGRFQEAISLLEESININERNLGSHSRGVGVDMLKLANVYRAKADYEMAQKYFQQVKSIFKEEIPKNHYREAEYYFKYAKLKQEMDKLQEAKVYFKKAHTIYLDLFGENSNQTKKVKSYLDHIAQA